ncbi:hypothetical protein COOONC_21565 [Cooperia oncophora]
MSKKVFILLLIAAIVHDAASNAVERFKRSGLLEFAVRNVKRSTVIYNIAITRMVTKGTANMSHVWQH